MVTVVVATSGRPAAVVLSKAPHNQIAQFSSLLGTAFFIVVTNNRAAAW
jgi:imidazoleglycerol phosphate dehydratase HisB